MYLSKLKRIEYKEPHQACANFLAVNNCLILAIYYELTQSFYLFALFLVLGICFFSYFFYYLLTKLFRNKGDTYPILTWRAIANNSLSQNLAFLKQSVQNKTKWYAVLISALALVFSWGATLLLLSWKPSLDQLGIWVSILFIDTIQIAATFLLFDGFKKLLKYK